jgi:hypothetical protein
MLILNLLICHQYWGLHSTRGDFLDSGICTKRGEMRKDKDGVPEPVPMWRADRGKKEDDPFF